jgi:hypothetical protein
VIVKNILFSILALFLCNSIGAQILNIDREVGADTAMKSWSASITSSFSSDKLKGNLIDFSNRTEFDKRLKNNYVIIGQLNTDLTFLEKNIIQNEGYFQLRYRDFDKRKLSLESYLQYQWNGSLGMAYRKVIGSNARVQLLEKDKLDLYSGVGVFYETEKWNYENNITNRNLYRLNQYFKFASKINEKIDISTNSYLQFPINKDFTNTRWFLELNANVNISKKVNFVIHWDHTLDNYRVVPISNFYYSLNFGVQVVL